MNKTVREENGYIIEEYLNEDGKVTHSIKYPKPPEIPEVEEGPAVEVKPEPSRKDLAELIKSQALITNDVLATLVETMGPEEQEDEEDE